MVQVQTVLSYLSGLRSKCRVSRSVVSVLGRKMEKMFSVILIISHKSLLKFLIYC